MQVSNAFLLLHILGFLFKRLLQSAHAFRSRVVLRDGASCCCCCCGAHQWALGPLNAQLDVTLTPALGELSPQFLCLCMACWKSDSDYLQYRFSMPNNVRLKSQWKRCTRIIMNPLYTWVNSRNKTKQDCFAAAVHMLASQVEPNMSPACLLSALASHGSLQNIFKAFTTTPLQKKTRNEWMMY